jgi:ABC-type lipoprotein export system ATPase subunit
MTVAVRVKNLIRRYPEKASPALASLTFELEAGARLLVAGPSGSGKSTLLHLLGGLDRPDSGSIEIAGNRLDKLPEGELARMRGRLVGVVFQHHLLPAGLTAEETVAAPLLWTRGMTPAEATRRAGVALESVGLTEEEWHRPVQNLSGGQRQRVALARAVAPDPPVLLADEPTAQLDAKAATVVTQLMLEWANRPNKTLVVASHQPILDGIPDVYTMRLADGRVTSFSPVPG